MKVAIGKVTAEGETLSAEIVLEDANEWDSKVSPALRKLDDRLYEMNQRVLRSQKLVRELPPEAQLAVHQVFEILYGRNKMWEPVAQQVEEAPKA